MVIHHTTALFSVSNTVNFTWTCVSMRVYSGHHADRLQSGIYRGADKSLARPGMKQATATEDFDVHISYLLT